MEDPDERLCFWGPDLDSHGGLLLRWYTFFATQNATQNPAKGEREESTKAQGGD